MTQSRYIAGWEIDFDNHDQFKKILLTQGIDSYGFELFSTIQSATELVIEDGKTIKAIQHFSDIMQTSELDIPLPIEDWPDRCCFFLSKDSSGIHNIGGPIPNSFQVPHHNALKSNFIYIGTLDCSDPKFRWLNLDKLHLTYPVYEGAFEIYLDYQNPNAPVILNPEIFNYSWIDDNVKGIERVKFVSQNYKTIEKVDFDELINNNKDYLHCGVPKWYQYPQIPTCPKTGKLMQFVCTINSDSDIVFVDNEGIENPPFADRLIFGDEGYLYVFYEPESKVLSLNVQF